MDIDVELDQILSNVLSLEEDYPLPQYEYNKNGFTNVLRELLDIFPSEQSKVPMLYSGILQQNHVDSCTFSGIPHETRLNQSLESKNPEYYMNKTQGTYKGIKMFDWPLHAEQTEGCKRQRCMNDIYLPMASNRTVKRTQFSMEQTAYLLNQFELDPYPDFVRRCQIANLAGIPEPRIQVWFQNRRARHLMEPKNYRRSVGSGGPATVRDQRKQNKTLLDQRMFISKNRHSGEIQSAKRTQFSEEQTTFLLNQFELDPYPDFIKRCHIANITQIPEPRIQVWFQNRRARHFKVRGEIVLNEGHTTFLRESVSYGSLSMVFLRGIFSIFRSVAPIWQSLPMEGTKPTNRVSDLLPVPHHGCAGYGVLLLGKGDWALYSRTGGPGLAQFQRLLSFWTAHREIAQQSRISSLYFDSSCCKPSTIKVALNFLNAILDEYSKATCGPGKIDIFQLKLSLWQISKLDSHLHNRAISCRADRRITVKRTQFSMEQTEYLLNQFELDPYPDFVKRCRIANLAGIPEPRIQVWFQNRRARHLMEPRTTRSNLESH
ncbi:homeobox siamois-like [Pelobates cultripes]|uniref:Homeobox protein siamois n=1 Tax=Pelobates cultripes TaxID=61616 RepID=A0AAD1RJ02_PELCU|nr:homeobox siamois-like [Pelobates cultripes]